MSDLPQWIKPHNAGAVLQLRVIPRASHTKFDGIYGDAVKMRLQAPPVDGKANKALVQYLHKTTGIPSSAMEVLSGETGRNKRLLFMGITPEDLAAMISSLL